MDMGHYVNSPVDEGRNSLEKRENCHSGHSKVVRVVGVSFGLLCIIQSAVSVSLRLQGIGFCNKSNHINSTNVNWMSTADISALLLEKDQLAKENSWLTVNNKVLNDQLSQQQDQIMELKVTLSEIQQKLKSCPLGWKPYMSSCYQLSTERKSWRYATEDCVAKGAHLVIINDKCEEDVLRTFGRSAMWTGLKAKQKGGLKTWSWVDGSRLTYPIQLQPDDLHFYCAYFQQSQFGWVHASCGTRLYWVCEKKLQ